LANQLSLNLNTVVKWFQNRRSRLRQGQSQILNKQSSSRVKQEDKPDKSAPFASAMKSEKRKEVLKVSFVEVTIDSPFKKPALPERLITLENGMQTSLRDFCSACSSLTKEQETFFSDMMGEVCDQIARVRRGSIQVLEPGRFTSISSANDFDRRPSINFFAEDFTPLLSLSY